MTRPRPYMPVFLTLAALVGMSGCAMPQGSMVLVPAPSPAPPPILLPEEPREIGRAALLPPGGHRLSLDALLEMAQNSHPDLGIARARTGEAQGRAIQAGLYPNPTFTWEGDNMASKGNGAGSQGLIFSQRIVTAGKLRLSEAVASLEVSSLDFQAMSRWFEVATRVRLAYFDVLTAQEEVRVQEEIVSLAREGLKAAETLNKVGVGNQPDVLQARVEWRQREINLETARQRLEVAWKQLAVAIGTTELPRASLEGSLNGPIPDFVQEAALDLALNYSTEVQSARTNLLRAEQAVRRARAGAVPDLQVSIQPYYSFPEHDAQLQVQVGAALPVFDRNQGNIFSAQAELARAHEEVRRTQLLLTERLNAAFLRFQTARIQKEKLEGNLLPDAEEALKLVRLGYDRGDPKYDYTALLQAQRTQAQARLMHVQALGEVWRAASEIWGLTQVDRRGE